jgi:hypothetical protein
LAFSRLLITASVRRTVLLSRIITARFYTRAERRVSKECVVDQVGIEPSTSRANAW